MPDDLEKFDVAPKVQLRIEHSSNAPSPPLLQKIDKLWASGLSQGTQNLFNGKIFSVVSLKQDHISVAPVEYKYFYAQVCEPALFDDLRIRPLACTGVLNCDEGIIFGRRSHNVTLDQGKWELAPSGVFDGDCEVMENELSSTKLLRKEAEEELGIPHNHVQPGDVHYVIQDNESHAVDLIVAVAVTLSGGDVLRYFENRTNLEYSEIKIISPRDLGAFLQANASSMSAISRTAIELRRG